MDFFDRLVHSKARKGLRRQAEIMARGKASGYQPNAPQRAVLRAKVRLETDQDPPRGYVPIRLKLWLCCGHRTEYITQPQDVTRPPGIPNLEICWQCPPTIRLHVLQPRARWAFVGIQPSLDGAKHAWQRVRRKDNA